MKIDAVELVRKIRDEIYEETKSMNPQERIEYLKKMSAEFRKEHPVQDIVNVGTG